MNTGMCYILKSTKYVQQNYFYNYEISVHTLLYFVSYSLTIQNSGSTVLTFQVIRCGDVSNKILRSSETTQTGIDKTLLHSLESRLDEILPDHNRQCVCF